MRFVLGFLASLLLSQFCVLAINLYTDSDGVFWRGYPLEKAIAEKMLKGYDISGPQDMNLRAIALQTIDNVAQSPEILVLGSSRAMLVGENLLARANVRNHSVPSARLLHYLAVYERYNANGMLPKTVMIGVDPWIFKQETIAIPPMGPAARAGAALIGVDSTVLGLDDRLPWQTLFSGKRAWSALTSSGAHGGGQCARFKAQHGDDGPCAVRRHDGSLKYPEMLEKQTDEQVAQPLRRTARGRMHSYEGYRQIDKNRVKALQEFVSLLRREGSNVILFLVPYHPIVEASQTGRNDWELTTAAEDHIRGVARTTGAKLLGSYSAVKAGCSASEFYDGIHVRASCLAKILAPVQNVELPK